MTDLLAAAQAARAKAYAPYSGYTVGAAIRGADGDVYSGCNVENVSYPVSVCAERNAIAEMVKAGIRELSEIVVVSEDGGLPCGACLQVLLEFAPAPNDVVVRAVSSDGSERAYRLFELIPHGFCSGEVKRTER